MTAGRHPVYGRCAAVDVHYPRSGGARAAVVVAVRCQITASASTVAPVAGRRTHSNPGSTVLDLHARPAVRGKGTRVLDLYAGHLDGRRWAGRVRRSRRREDLGPGPLPLPPDAGPGQGPCDARQPRIPPRRRPAYLAAWDVHRGQVFGRCEPTTGIAPFHALVEQVMTQEPYASAKRVFWIVDNGSSHRGDVSVERMARHWPNAAPDPRPGPRLLARPGGDLLLRRPAQSPDTQRLHRPGPGP